MQANRYDSRTTTFSPEGRLYQVEYAMEAVSFSGTLLGVQTQHGIVMLAEKKTASKLLESKRQPEKLYPITQSIVCGVAGVTADANTLLKQARKHALAAEYAYGQAISVEQLAQALSDLKQSYTQFGGMRPFGVSLLYAGWDRVEGFQLLQSDPSGNYSRWRAFCVGANQQPITTALKTQYDAQMPLVEAARMALHIYAKSAEASCVSGERLEMATLELVQDDSGESRLLVKMYNAREIDAFIKSTEFGS